MLGIVVEPGVDIGPDTVVVVTPYGNPRGRAFWVRKEEDADAFVIRIADRRRDELAFGWMVVEPTVGDEPES